ncbi:MAG: archaeoflavoprotein AfpA [Candidatus Bathyarchaeota archaeon]|nr:MAG: archaeoflavoprotein AfpA [Candidatus Bathyarchaeota archaeon]
MTKREKAKKKRVAWGITGSGDRLAETIETMKRLKSEYQDGVEIQVYISKAGYQVVKWYKVFDDLEQNFGRVLIEINSNSPFLAGQLQLGKFEFLVIGPTTSNTVAKISTGIADTMLSNAAIMGLKAFVPVYIMPSDYEEGIIVTRLPSEREIKLRIRKEDVEHVKRLAGMADVFILKKPEEIHEVFKKHFTPKGTL